MRKYIGIFSLLLILTALSSAVSAMQPCIFCGDVKEEICRNCHEDLEALPMLKDRNQDKHHLLYGTPIPPLIQSKAPDAPGSAQQGEPYGCFSCHSLVWTDRGELQSFRDCLMCHPVWRVTGHPMGNNVHHETETFRQHNCKACHSRTGGLAADEGSATDGGDSMGGGRMGGGRMGGSRMGR